MVRSDLLEIKLPKGRGRVQHGSRYAVVVQADDLLSLSTVIISPTSSSSPPATFHPEIEVGSEATRVLCEMTGAVDSRLLGEQIGHLSIEEMRSVDEALALVLDLG